MAVICAIFVSFTYVAGQMRGTGIVFSRMLFGDMETVMGMTPVNAGVVIGDGGCFVLCGFGWDEGDYLHPGGAVFAC